MGVATVIVPDNQLSLAIGKEGQNARLAARLTGWRVDIKSETQLAEEAAYQTDDWAQGEWIVHPETGEQMWQPADGSPAMTLEQVQGMQAEARADADVDEAVSEVLEAVAEDLAEAIAEVEDEIAADEVDEESEELEELAADQVEADLEAAADEAVAAPEDDAGPA
jgi:N utilization substance protein A